nr:hypothetical protein Iba_chr14bCG14710 [Ipomoea batatas]
MFNSVFNLNAENGLFVVRFPSDVQCRTSNTPCGNFVKDSELQYINGDVKFIKEAIGQT